MEQRPIGTATASGGSLLALTEPPAIRLDRAELDWIQTAAARAGLTLATSVAAAALAVAENDRTLSRGLRMDGVL